MNLQLDRPNIFPSNIISGFTKANFGIDSSLEKGVSFRFSEPEFYAKSIQILAKFLQVEPIQFKIPIQSHSNRIAVVDRNTEAEKLDVDALISNDPEVILGAKSADCCVVLLYDSVEKVWASVHSGRAGTEQEIARKTVLKMMSEFGCKTENISAYLSTSVGAEMYAVYQSKLEKWPNKYLLKVTENLVANLPEENRLWLINELKTYDDDPNYFVDIKGWIKDQLLESGLQENKIEISPFCSIKNTGYHSYHKDPKDFGLALGFIGLKT